MSLLLGFLLGLPWFVLTVLIWRLWAYKRATLRRARREQAAGRWVVVTGAASGIGRAVVLELLNLGAKVFAADLNLAALEAAFGGDARVVCVRVDVTSQSDVDLLAKRINESKVALHGVVNSAGVASPPAQKRTMVLGAAETVVEEDVLPVYNVNLFGMIRVNTALFPSLFEARGRVINIASVAGRLAAPGMSVYSGTKHAVVAYTAAMRREFEPYAMHAFSIEPGFTDTALVAKPMAGVGPDMSRTRLVKTFADMESSESVAALFGSLQSAEVVAHAVAATLFCDEWIPPHVVVDESKFWVYVIGSILPHHWIDWLLAQRNRMVARKQSSNEKQQQ
jgi:NAD(P)-dependent dehydrogenase (short-subunit alcohol dehydrogenase family)